MYRKVIFESVNLMAQILCQEGSSLSPGWWKGKTKKKAFVKEVAKALSVVALCYQMYFLRNAENNFLIFFG